MSLITGKGSKKVVNYSRKFSIFYYPRYIFVFIQGKSQEESRVIETLNKIYNLIRIHFFSPFFFFRLPLFQNPSICFICAGERNLLPVCTECLCHASRASSVPGFSTAAAGLTSSNLLFCMSLCRGIPVLVSFVRKKKKIQVRRQQCTYQEVSQKDTNRDLSDRRNEDGCSFLDFGAEVLIKEKGEAL